ncbi:MAG: response regulator [Hyphomicrobiales bacterium]|nr:response regulator [Hyphomicrobiales bacterium]
MDLAAGAKADVLIVDDNAAFAEFVRDAAEYCGRSAVVITNSTNFMEQCRVVRPRTVVLDIEMPDINGFQLAQWLGEFEAELAEPVQLVIVSGKGIDVLRLGGSVAEISGLQNVNLLTKPIELASLIQIFRGERTG